MSVLLVVAHADDEVLGAGGTAACLAAEGIPVRSCIVAAEAEARVGRPRMEELHHDLLKANEILGLGRPILGCFPNIRLNTVPHLELVQFIEEAIIETRPGVILTHHPRDLNDDHRQVSAACQAAARIAQRRPGLPRLRGLYFMEILSSSEWSFPGPGPSFDPDAFFEIGPEGLERKLQALAAYRGVMRDYPHPRSREAVRSLAVFRGAQSGLNYAEAFQSAFRTLRSADFVSTEQDR